MSYALVTCTNQLKWNENSLCIGFNLVCRHAIKALSCCLQSNGKRANNDVVTVFTEAMRVKQP